MVTRMVGPVGRLPGLASAPRFVSCRAGLPLVPVLELIGFAFCLHAAELSCPAP